MNTTVSTPAAYRLSAQQAAVVEAERRLGGAIHSVASIELAGRPWLEAASLQRRLDALVAEHEVLRTAFVERQGLRWPLQIVSADGAQRIQSVEAGAGIDARALACHGVSSEAGGVLGIVLETAQGRPTALTAAASACVLDEQSLRELLHALASDAEPNGGRTVVERLQYIDYSEWQHDLQESELGREGASFWTPALDGEVLAARWPLESVRSAGPERAELSLYDGAAIEALAAFARDSGASLRDTVFGCFVAFASRLLGSDDVVCAYATRELPEDLRGALGCFARDLPLRLHVDRARSLVQSLSLSRARLEECLAFQDCFRGAELIAAWPARQELIYPASFRWVEGAEGLREARASVSSRAVARLGLVYRDRGAETELCFEYAPRCFEPDAVRALAHQFAAFVQAARAEPERALSEVPLIGPRERHQLLSSFASGSLRPGVPGGSVRLQELFERRAAQQPEQPAVVFRGASVSYAELDRRANQVAHALRAAGVRPDEAVGVYSERSVELVVALLAVLKAGGAYLPLDPHYPPERLALMIEDAGVRRLLVGQHPPALEPPALPGVARVSLAPDAPIWRESERSLAPLSGGDNLAYVIYTSGSTGKPKGVMVSHANARASTLARPMFYAGTVQSFLLLSSVSFDSSVAGIFWTLSDGGQLVLPEEGEPRDPGRVAALLVQHRVSHLLALPSLYERLLDEPAPPALRCAIVAGEACPEPLVSRHFEQRPNVDLVNEYGPTEASVWCTAWRLSASHSGRVPIGRPIGAMRVYVLDARLGLAPIGAAGELYAAGPGITRGYLARPSLTAERFLPDPFGAPGTRMYRTGDGVRWRANGALEFIGRGDGQVKIRGYRIELGEIEARLRAAAAVSDVCVVVREEQRESPRLVAYLVGSDPSLLADGARRSDWLRALRQKLAAELPNHMLPAQMALLAALPKSPNGKLDRARLPDPESLLERPFIAPRSELERRIAGVWEEVLHVERVGAEDNFFERGGDSIVSLRVVARARQVGVEISARDIFQHQTVAALAACARRLDDGAETQQAWPLAPAQRRALAFGAARCRWIEIEAAAPIERAAAERALGQVVARHPALRVQIRRNAAGLLEQRPRAASDGAGAQHAIPIVTADGNANAFEQARRAVEASLSPGEGRHVGAVIGASDAALRMAIGVLETASDERSVEVLLEDFSTAYSAARAGEEVRWPSAASSFGTWLEHARLALGSDEASSDRAASASEPAARAAAPLEAAGLHAAAVSVSGGTDPEPELRVLRARIDATLVSRLRERTAPEQHASLSELALTALGRAWCQTFEQPSFRLELERDGRELLPPASDVRGVVGPCGLPCSIELSPPGGATGEARARGLRAIKQGVRAVAARAPSPMLGAPIGAATEPATRARGAASVAAYASAQARSASSSAAGAVDVCFDARQAPARSDGHFDRLSLPEPTSPRLPAHATAGVCLIGDAQGLRLSLTFRPDSGLTSAFEGLLDAVCAELEALGTLDRAASVEALCPSDFPLAGANQDELERLPIALEDVEDLYPLTPMQEGMLMHTLLEPGSGIYLMQDYFSAHAAIDVPVFERAWQRAMRRHAVLRTGFIEGDGRPPLQVVYRSVPLPFEYFDWRGLSAEQTEQELSEILRRERLAGFDMARAPLWRLRLVRTSEGEYVLAMSNHHILLDAWSRSLLLEDVLDTYQALLRGESEQPPRAAPFRDFIGWLAGRERELGLAYWRTQLSSFERATPLPFDVRAGNDAELSSIRDVMKRLDAEQTAALDALARRHTLTMNTFVQAAWALTLARHSGSSDVLFGVTTAGRPSEAALQRTVGLFINSIPLRISVPRGSVSVQEWLARLQAQNLSMREHEHLPLVRIQECSSIARGEPLFHSLVVFENAPVQLAVLEHAQAMAASRGSSRTHTNYPVTVVIVPGPELGLQLSCDERFFEPSTIEKLAEEFRRLLLELMGDLQRPVCDLPLLAPSEKAELLAYAPGPQRDYPFERGLVELFEERAAEHPNRVAAACMGQDLTYAELDQRANAVAWGLVERGVRLDEPVLVLEERSLDLLALILGVWKAGAAYVPLDPRHPLPRLTTMAGSTPARVLLTASAASTTLARDIGEQAGRRELQSVRLAPRELSPRRERPARHAGPRNLAYVIFTSGSTGVPKGAMVEHAGMLNNVLSKVPFLQLDERDVIAQTASQAFDISVWQLVTGLSCGARVEIFPDEIAHDALAFADHLRATGATIVESVPTLIQHLLGAAGDAPLPLRVLITTGEAMQPELAARWLERYPEIPLLNAYGPAECADDVALAWIRRPPARDGVRLSVGTATDNNRLHVLDADLGLVPRGAAGELCVAGIGVGRGYLGDAARTAEKFVPNPYATSPGERLYRTGDAACWVSDGTLEFVGRRDHQLKIRGARVEPGEIEARLLRHPSITSAVVVARRAPTGKQLVAYHTCSPGPVPSAEELKAHLRAGLPEFMIPTQFCALERLPTTPNGKIDRQALPEPEWTSRELAQPSTEAERVIAGIWQQVLGVASVGRHDNFFELGGDSLLAAQVLSRLQRGLGVRLTLRQVLTAPDLAALAALAEGAGAGGGVAAARATDLEAMIRDVASLSEGELAELLAGGGGTP